MRLAPTTPKSLTPGIVVPADYIAATLAASFRTFSQGCPPDGIASSTSPNEDDGCARKIGPLSQRSVR